MIEELVARVFASRNAAHLAHWKETSGFRHETLGAFYDDVIGAIDDIVEAHQGAFDLIDVSGLPKQPKVDDIVELLEDDMVFISENRKKITSGLPAIDNLLQGLEHIYLRTLYKLRKLK